MKKRITAFLCAAVIAAAGLAGCGGTKAPAEVQTADVTEGENVTAGASEATAEAAADSVIVTMPTTSEPEAGFNPVYGWGAGEHVHEPLIQSTLTTTTADLKIGKDGAAVLPHNIELCSCRIHGIHNKEHICSNKNSTQHSAKKNILEFG